MRGEEEGEGRKGALYCARVDKRGVPLIHADAASRLHIPQRDELVGRRGDRVLRPQPVDLRRRDERGVGRGAAAVAAAVVAAAAAAAVAESALCQW